MKSTAHANAVLDAYFGSGTPATLYIGLFTAMPASDGTGGTEVTGGSYARKAVTNNSTNFPAAAGGAKANAVSIDFATATALWGNVVGAGVFPASTGGNPDYFAELDADRTVNSGDAFSFAIGQLIATEA
jgi:hypothetical protein